MTGQDAHREDLGDEDWDLSRHWRRASDLPEASNRTHNTEDAGVSVEFRSTHTSRPMANVDLSTWANHKRSEGPKWSAEADQARQSPDVWFEITERDTEDAAWSFAAQIRNGRKTAFRPAGTFDASSHGRKVFLRYRGTGEAEKK